MPLLSAYFAELDRAWSETAGPRIALHLIVTPEYIRKLQDAQPEVEIYALRLDRGLTCETNSAGRGVRGGIVDQSSLEVALERPGVEDVHGGLRRIVVERRLP